MFGLLPVEYWDFGLDDVLRGFTAASEAGFGERSFDLPGIGPSIPARSARAAIVCALKALNLPKEASIGVPLYCCPVVFKAIRTAGFSPRFLDVASDTFCISTEDLSKKKTQIDAIIAVHMFGNVCDVPRLHEAAPGKPIIEDCAQSLGSSLNGRMAGALGAVSVFSFRTGKYLSVGEGGALFAAPLEVRLRAHRVMAEMPVHTRGREYVHVMRIYLRSLLRSRPLYGAVGHALWRFYNNTAQFSQKIPVVLSQIFKSDFAVATHRLPSLHDMVKAQRAYADYFCRNLRLEPGMLCYEPNEAFYNRYQFPVTFSRPEYRDFMAEYLYKRQIDTSRPLDEVPEIATAHFGYAGDCPVSEWLAKRVLVIPSHHGLNRKQIERISQQVNQGWGEIVARKRKTVKIAQPSAKQAMLGPVAD